MPHIACLHDQNKSVFLRPAFFQPVRALWNLFKLVWLAGWKPALQRNHLRFDHVNRLIMCQLFGKVVLLDLNGVKYAMKFYLTSRFSFFTPFAILSEKLFLSAIFVNFLPHVILRRRLVVFSLLLWSASFNVLAKLFSLQFYITVKLFFVVGYYFLLLLVDFLWQVFCLHVQVSKVGLRISFSYFHQTFYFTRRITPKRVTSLLCPSTRHSAKATQLPA